MLQNRATSQSIFKSQKHRRRFRKKIIKNLRDKKNLRIEDRIQTAFPQITTITSLMALPTSHPEPAKKW